MSVKIRYDHQNCGHSQKIDSAHTFYIDRPLYQSNQNRVSGWDMEIELIQITSKHPGNDNMSPAPWTLGNWLAKINKTMKCSLWRLYIVTIEAYVTSHRKNLFQLVQVNKCFMCWILWCDIHWFMSAPKTDNFWHSFIHSTYYFKPIIQTLLVWTNQFALKELHFISSS